MTGSVTVNHLLDAGHQVIGLDVAPYPASLPPRWSRPDFSYTFCDLTDYGDTVEALAGADAVVHLANIPAPTIYPAARTLNRNTLMNNNVFLAAVDRGIPRVVWASSETTLGLDFSAENVPDYVPLDEDHYPKPTTTYSLSKVLAETMAEQLAAWSSTTFVALRLSNVITPEAYAGFPAAWADPALRQFNLWSYIDVRDAAEACRLALTADVPPCSSYIIAAADSAMPVPSEELLEANYPGLRRTRPVSGFESLMTAEKARRVLGFVPAHSWREHVQG